ncbi:MAG: sulfatase-like hydrolase/transferase [Thermodesulfobacteriota bacterium]
MPSLEHSSNQNIGDTRPNGAGVYDSMRMRWLTALLLVILSSIFFAGLFEWDRYRMMLGSKMQGLGLLDTVLFFWLLVAKSLLVCLPALLICGGLLTLGLNKPAAFTLTFWWILAFYLQAADLMSMGYAGYHVWDYLPYIRDILDSPGLSIWQWGERLATEATLVFAFFVVLGLAVYLATKFAARKLVDYFPRSVSAWTLSLLTTGFVFAALGIFPALDFLQDRIFLDRAYSGMPVHPRLKEFADGLDGYLPSRIGTNRANVMAASMSTIGDSSEGGRVPGFTWLGSDALKQTDVLTGLDSIFKSWIGEEDSGNSAGEANRLPRIRLGTLPKFLSPHGDTGVFKDLFPRLSDILETRTQRAFMHAKPEDDPHAIVSASDRFKAERLVQDSADPGPADLSAWVNKEQLPDVLLIIFESFRHSAVGPELMKELDGWSKQGLRLQRHYSGSNCSHLGLFSLFFGRAPVGYHRTLNRKIPPQMLESLRRSGYEITFLTSGEIQGFRRVHQFLGEEAGHRVIRHGEFTLKGSKEWPEADRWKLGLTSKMLREVHQRPQFIFYYLVSTHFPYVFPPEFTLFEESPSLMKFIYPREQLRNHLNRYANAALFLEHEVMKLMRSLDLNRTVVMMTGDHGESMGEDGVFTHGSRMSEIQMRVPFLMVGKGVPPRTIATATVHTDVLPTLLHALAGTEIPIRNCHGRDLLADPSPADEVMLVPGQLPDRDGFMMIRGNQRILFRCNAEEGSVPWVEFAGLADEAGHVELRVPSDKLTKKSP